MSTSDYSRRPRPATGPETFPADLSSERREDYLFIEAGPLMYEGQIARQKLESLNDSSFVQGRLGIPSVSSVRWKVAQTAERLHWFNSVESSVNVADDRNLLHKERFDNYAAIRGFNFRRAVEIGCGPFTNLRLMASICRLGRAHLLDPMANEYLKHKNTYYSTERLARIPASSYFPQIWIRFPVWIKSAWKKIFGIPATIVNSPIEGFNAENQFDLVVMINVLEHVQDARKALLSVRKLLENGGVLVLADKTYGSGDIESGVRRVYDAAHPIRISETFLDECLSGLRTLYRRDFPDEMSKFFPGAVETYRILSNTTGGDR